MAILLRTEDLTHKFGGLLAVGSVNYELKEGELAAIIGPNGAGKSTLFKLITGLLSPTKGKIYFNGNDITNMAPYERVTIGIAKSFQICQIFPRLTTLENAVVAVQNSIVKSKRGFYFSSWNNRESIERAEEILERIGLLSDKDKLVGALPQGCKKRLEVGMAVATNPKLLLLDEPTAGSTPVETHQMMDLIKELSKIHTILVVEHKMDVVMNLAHRISVMHRGKIIAEGTPQEIRSNYLVREVYLGEEFHA